MPEEIPQLPVSPQETQIQAPSLLEKISAQKKKILIGLGSFLGVLILVGAAFGVYKYVQKQVQPASQPTPTPIAVATTTPDETANWETYTNTKYGFSIKYPPNWGQGIEIASFTKDGYSLTIASAPEELSRPPGIMITTSKVKVGSRDYLKSTWKRPDGKIDFERIDLGTEENLEIVLNYKNNLYSEEYERIFNLILSSFKFLEESAGEKVFCKEPRPEVCTMECLVNPPYICGADGESYCTECQACANLEVAWYVIQDEPCGSL